MAKPKVAEDEVRNAFVKKHFSRFYEKEGVLPVDKLESREFGIITERSGMWRHLGFGSQAELERFIRRQVPMHAYRSSAYYQNPGARTMDEKDWLGADLIFDLDADHIKGGEKLKLGESLALVKKEFVKLVDSYLLGDFGFAEKDVQIVFSGGRGYHAHVMDPRVRRLDSHQRREIVDYITGTGLDIDRIFPKKVEWINSYKEHSVPKYTRSFRPKETGGWPKKIYNEISIILNEFEHMEKKDVIKELKRLPDVGDSKANGLYADLFEGQKGKRGVDRMLAENKIEVFSNDKNLNAFLSLTIGRIKIELEGETDEPVTSDTKRLIRLPGTLHGKTSLIARHLSRTELDGFDPLRDGFWQGFGDAPVKVLALDDYGMKLKGNDFGVTKGQQTELPEFAALFFACQKKVGMSF